MKNALAKIIVLFGVLLLGLTVFFAYKKINPRRLSFQNYKEQKIKFKKTVLPVKLKIQDLNIELSVEPTEIQENVWPISKTGVSYLFSSGSPGEVGNSIFYGHNFAGLLANLRFAKVGEIIEVTMGNKKIYKYKISGITTVKPSQTEILKAGERSILTLYTCSGFFDELRFVVTAKLIN